MSDVADNTPVLVGIGAVQQKHEDWTEAKEAVELMVDAVRAAIADTKAERLGAEIGCIYVPRGLWHYPDPARYVAAALGAKNASTVLVEIGVLQQTAIGDACRQIAEGKLETAMVVGGEAKYRDLRARIAGQEAPETEQTDKPDVTMTPAAELYLDAEVNSGLGYMPVNYYAIMESAFRASQGWSVEEHRDRLATMYSRFSDIATNNPHAWKPGHVEPQMIRDASQKNPMLAFPYTKLHNTSWNVDQAGALVFCSAAKAKALGIPRDQWIFPLASAECGHMLSVAQRKELHRAPGVKAAGEKVLALTGCTAQEVDFIELYSCFPVAVETFAAELGIDLERQLTVTGGMPFAGGPLNNYVIQATCRMAELLRNSPGSKGILSSVSGLLTKQGIGLWSADPGITDFQFIDVTEEVAADNPPMAITENYDGAAIIAGYTVMYEQGEPSRAVAMVDLPDGSRSVVWSDSAELLAAMEREEFCGRTVQCAGNQFTSVLE